MKNKILLFLLLTPCFLIAQEPGSLDLSFNSNDTIKTLPRYDYHMAAIQADGKIVVGASYFGKHFIARFNSNGTPDPGFATVYLSGKVNAITIQNDGKIIVGGEFGYLNNNFVGNLIRLDSNGNYDSSFTYTSYRVIKKILLTKQEKIILIENSNMINSLKRLNLDGSIDTNFNENLDEIGWIRDIAESGTGQLAVAGLFPNSGQASYHAIHFLDYNGFPESNNPDKILFNNTITSIAYEPNGKLVAGGVFSSCQGQAVKNLIRLNVDGSIDASFNAEFNNFFVILGLCLLADGKIAIGTEYNSIKRYNNDGSIDTTFSSTSVNGSVTTLLPGKNKSLLLIGYGLSFTGESGNYSLLKTDSTGRKDMSFHFKPGWSARTFEAVIQSDKIIATGFPITCDGAYQHFYSRLSINGDCEENLILPSSVGFPDKIIPLKSGKLLIAGSYSFKHTLHRMNYDGSIDTTFSNIGFNSAILTIHEQEDEKILIGGSSVYALTWPYTSNIVRLDSNGNLDHSFINNLVDFGITAIATLPSGKILLGGYNKLIRLNPNGSIDHSFKLSGLNLEGHIMSITILENEKIMIGGNFGNGNIARLLPDGTKDSYSLGSGFDNSINCMLALPGNKLLIGGEFTRFRGQNRNRIIKLKENLSVDDEFKTGSGFDSTVTSMSITNDGKFLIGGNFTEYNGIVRSGIAKIYDDSFVGIKNKNLMFSKEAISIYPNPAQYVVNIKVSGNFTMPGSFIVIFNSAGQLIESRPILQSEEIQQLNLNNYKPGIYFLKFINQHKTISKKLIVF